MKKSLVLLILLGMLMAAGGCKTAPEGKEAEAVPTETAAEPVKREEPGQGIAQDSEKPAEEPKQTAGYPVQTPDARAGQNGGGSGSAGGGKVDSGKKSSANSVVQTQKRTPAPVKANTAVRPSPHPAGVPTQSTKQAAAKDSKNEKVDSKQSLAKDDTAQKDASKADTSKKETAKADTSKKDTAKANTSKKETAKADTSKKETTKADTSKKDTAKADTSKKDTAKADTSKKDTAKADSTKKDTAKANTTKKDTAKADTSKKETVKADTAKKDTAKADTSKKDTAKADTSKKETAKADTSKKDTAKADTSKKDTAKADTSKKDTAKADTSKKDTAKADIAKKDTAKVDTSKKDTAKANTTKKETAKADTTKKETAKADTTKKDTAKADTSKKDTAKADIAKKDTAKADTSKKDTTKADTSKKDTAKADTAKKETAKADTKTAKQDQDASGQNAAMSDAVNAKSEETVQKEAAPYVASAQIIDASWMIEQADVSFVSKQYKGSGKMFVTILAQYKGDLVAKDFQEAAFFSPTDIWSLDAETAQTLMEIDTKNKLLTFKHLAAGDGEGAVSLGKWFVSITLAGQKPFEKELNVTGIGGQTIAIDSSASAGNGLKKIVPMVVPVVQAAGEQAALEFPVIQSVSRDAETIEIIFSINDERVKNAYFYFDIPDEEYYRDSGSMIDPAGQPVNGCRVFSTDGKKCQYILRKDENNKVWFNKATRCFLVVSDVNRVASPWEERHRTIGAAAQISR